MVKPCGSGDTVNVAIVQRKFMSLSGEACLPCGSRQLSVNCPVEGVTGDPMPGISMTLPHGNEIRITGSKQTAEVAAPSGVTLTVRRQESAEVIVAQRRE